MILTYLTGNCALAQLFCHQTVFHVRELRAIFEMVLGQKHVPDALAASLALQIIHDAGVTLPSCFAGANLGSVDGFCGDGFFFDEFLDLERNEGLSWVQRKMGNQGIDREVGGSVFTLSRSCLALSETKGTTMGGISCDAGILVEAREIQ